VRYPRGQGPGVALAAEMTALPLGKAVVRREGHSGLLILAFGALVKPAEIIGERLDATVVNMRFVKPLDEELVLRMAARHRALITIEVYRRTPFRRPRLRTVADEIHPIIDQALRPVADEATRASEHYIEQEMIDFGHDIGGGHGH